VRRESGGSQNLHNTDAVLKNGERGGQQNRSDGKGGRKLDARCPAKMQKNSDNAERLSSEETRAGGITTPVLWRAEASLRMERMVSALVTASKGGE